VSIKGEVGGAKAQERIASMTAMVLGHALELFVRHPLQNLRLQAASRYRPIAFDPESSPLDRRFILTRFVYYSFQIVRY
jgi:hypothetical protein